MVNKKIKKDIVIVGSGIVGSTITNCLKETEITKHLSIAIIDPTIKKEKIEIPHFKKEPLDLRTVALTPLSKKLFERINVWEEVSKFSTKYNKMKVWDKESDISFNEEELGYVIENSVLQVYHIM
jgi:2-polyprenyl-6-methoxyphenol hydroxylase-like FAD-dependent oxidoreductase